MSDQSSGEPSFRQSAEEKRASETVMLNQDNLSELMAQAKEGTPAADPTPAPDAASVAPAVTQADESTKPNFVVIAIVAAVVIAAIVVVVLLTSSG